MIKFGKIINIFSNLIRLYPSWVKLNKNDFLFFCHVADMGETMNGKIYSKLLDPVFEQLENRGFSCLHITRGVLLNENQIYHNSISYDHIRLFYSKWWWVKRNFLKIFNLFIPDHYKITISKDLDSDFFNALLTNSNPRAIFCISAFKKLCQQALVCEVVVLEVLHGIGYSTLPPDLNVRLSREQLPDIILSFDDVSTKTFTKLSDQNKLMVRQIDNYWYRKFKEGHIPEEWKRPINKKKYRNTVLYSLQWGFDGDHEHFEGILENGILPNSILELIKQTENDILWLLRLHPVQLRSSDYESHRSFIEELTFKNSNTEYQFSSQLPLPSLLSIVDVHISMNSMTAYDAAYFGLKSLLLCPTLNTIYSSMFLDLLSTGYAIKLNYKDTYEILNVIEVTNKIEPLENKNEQVTFIDVLQEADLLKKSKYE